MADILKFENARTPLHLDILRGVGLPVPAHWRVERRGLAPHFQDAHLRAVPHLVASRRTGDVCVVHFLPGRTPLDVSDERANKAVLDASIVRRALERQGRRLTKVMSWLVFDDGGRIELHAPDSVTCAMLARAQSMARHLDGGVVSTAEISRLL